MSKEQNGYFGVIGEQYGEKDFQLGGEDTLPEPRSNFYKSGENEWHQPDVGKNSCTIHGTAGAFTDMTGYVFSLEERKELWEKAIELGANPDRGWWTWKAIDLVREYGSEKVGEKILSFVIQVGSHRFWEALDKGYTVSMSHRGNSAYNKDKLDGTLDDVLFGTTTYGHSIRCTFDKESNEYELIINSYSKNSAPNRYRIPKENFSKLVNNNVFYKNGYIFIPESDYLKFNTLQGVPVWARASVEKAIEKGIATKWDKDEMNRIVADNSVEKMLFRAGILTKDTGEGISKVRYIVVMDRLNLLNN